MNFDYSTEMNRPFIYSLIFSVVFHVSVAANWPFYRDLFSNKNQFKDIEITYLKPKEPLLPAQKEIGGVIKRSVPVPESYTQPVKMVSEESPVLKQAQRAENQPPRKENAQVKKEEIKVDKKPAAEQKTTVVIKQPIVQKPATVGPVDLEGLSLVPPSYSQKVRSSIIDKLDSDSKEGAGEVFIRFVIASNGELKELNVIDEKSTKNSLLRVTAFEAIKNSAPFPKFPKDVIVPEVAFTCQICFIR